MKKKIFLFSAIMILLVSFTAITASADELFMLDCTGMDDVKNSSAWNDGYNSDFSYYEVIDEKIHMYGEMMPDGTKITQSMKIPFGVSIEGEALIFYDLMFPRTESNAQQGVSMQMFLGSNRATGSHNPTVLEKGVWYNVMIHVNEEQNAVYCRIKPASETEWGEKTAWSIAANSNAAGFKAYIQPNGDKATANIGELYFDNIRVIQGLFLDDLKFVMNETEITSVADITSEGEIKAVFNAANYDLDFNSDDIVIDRTEFTPIMLAFDKDGMMLDCIVHNDMELGLYDKDMEVAFDISNIYEELEGGTIRLYVWDSMDNMEAIFDEVVLPATAPVVK